MRVLLTCGFILGDGFGAEAHLPVRLSHRATAGAHAVLGARQRTERAQKESGGGGAREHHRTSVLLIIGTTTTKEMRKTITVVIIITGKNEKYHPAPLPG